MKITAPGNWSLKQRGEEWVLKSGMKGVVLRRDGGSMPETPEEAAKRFDESKILASEKLPSGAIYIFYEMDFPSESGSMKLKFVHSVVHFPGEVLQPAMCSFKAMVNSPFMNPSVSQSSLCR